MYKNQLQELAQRSCFNLPSYSCIREGPDHAPRFKATVNFNGEVFESPGYFSTLRQAEHAAADVALNTLSKRGPTQSLAARILDETGVCKNLLQETAQRAGVSLPVYTTIRTGPKHVPVFKCVVEVGGRTFCGEPAKTKKQAEKNAAMAAWSALKQWNPSSTPLLLGSSEGNDEIDRSNQSNALTVYRRDDRAGFSSNAPAVHPPGYAGRSRVTVVNVRDRNRHSREGSPAAQFYPGPSVSADPQYEQQRSRYFVSQQAGPSSLQGDMSYETVQGGHGGYHTYGHLPAALPAAFSGDTAFDTSGHGHGRYVYHQQSPAASVVSGGGSSSRQGAHQRRHSLPGFESAMLSREAMAASRATAGANLGRLMLQQQQHIRGLPLQSRSERFELRRPSLLEELQQREDEEDWLQGEINPAVAQRRSQRLPWQSRSERFELRRPLPELEELHFRDEEEWLRGESIRKNSTDRERGKTFADWSQGETASTGLQKEASHNHGYADDWSHSNVLSSSLQAERSHSQNYPEQWPCREDQSASLQTESSQGQSRSNTFTEDWLHRELNSKLQADNSHGHSHVHGQREEWSQGLLGSRLQKEKVLDRGEKKSSYSGAAPSSSSSSIWSRSAQWWGSHLPSSTSSAAAAFANTFGLRPASSLAPPVRVRQAVPVCSAPPRRPEASQRTPAPSVVSSHNDTPVDGETATRQLFDQLRL